MRALKNYIYIYIIYHQNFVVCILRLYPARTNLIQRTNSSIHCTGKYYVLSGVYLGELTRPGGIQIYAIEGDTLVLHDPKTSTLDYYSIS